LAASYGLPIVRGRLQTEPVHEEDEMQPKLLWILVLGAGILGTALYVGRVQAASSGFTATTTAHGRFENIDASNHEFFPGPSGSRHDGKLWLSFQQTKGPSDLYIQSNVWTPGGTTGWHTHPGHSLIVVTAGTVTAYEGHDPVCRPHVYTTGMGFVDEGGDHVHVLRNEGSVEARTMAVQLIPAGATRTSEAPGNPACAF
jgi:hypothetical protein